MTKEDRDKELKDIATRRIQLGDLVVRLGSFIGGGESVKKAVVNAIIAVFNSNEELKTLYSDELTNLSESDKPAGKPGDTVEIEKLSQRVTQEITEITKQIKQLKPQNNLNHNSPPSPSPSAESAKLQSKLEALKKVNELCGFYTNLKTVPNNAENILVNLCDGLQTFLGYDKDSKGYDGSGIVYSDLDRLCDGVMGFLSGVLSNIKGHLGQHKNEITEAIEALKKNKHAGKKGFNNAIEKVVKGVRGYNEAVKGSNKKINDVINTFANNINVQKTAINKFNDHTYFTQINNSVEECLHQAEQYKKGIDAAQNHVNDLQPEMKKKVEDSKDNIEYQRKELKRIHEFQKEQSKAVDTAVTKALGDVRILINTRNKEYVDGFVTELSTAVDTLEQRIINIDRALSRHVTSLNSWIREAHQAVVAVLKRVGEILDGVSGNAKTNIKGELLKAVKNLEGKALDLHRAYQKAHKGFPGLVTKVRAKIDVLDCEIVKGLETLKNDLEEGISEYIERAQGEFKVLKEKVEGSGESVQNKWALLISKIKANVNSLTKSGSGSTNLLGKVVDGVTSYAGDFTNETFGEKVLDAWIGEILDSNDTVKALVDMYVENTSLETTYKKHLSANEFSETTVKQIASKVRDQLKKQMQNAFEQFKVVGRESSIATNLENVKQGIAHFADELGRKVKEEELEECVDSIATAIEKDVLGNPDSENSKHHLTLALRYTLITLSTTAKQVSEQIDKLSTTTNIGNINAAILTVNKIGGYVNADDKKEVGGMIQTALDTIKSKIKGLDTILSTDDLGGEIDDAMLPYMHGQLREKMTAYAKHIEDNMTTGTLGTALRELSEKSFEAFNEPVLTKQINDLTITSAATDITNTHVQQLCDSIIKAAASDPHSAKMKLDVLKDTLIGKETNGELQKLHDKLYALQNKQLHSLIKAAGNIGTSLRTESTQILNELSQHVTEKINHANSVIANENQKHYVLVMKHHVDAFAVRCTTEINTLPPNIERDADKCYKGFMQKFHDEANNMQRSTEHVSNLKEFSSDVAVFYMGLLDTLKTNRDILHSPHKITELYDSLYTLLSDLTTFNRSFLSNLSSLSSLLDTIRPASYAEDSNPLLECLKSGVQRMCEELGKAYVSVYDGASDGFLWTNAKSKQLTDDANRCAKVCLTVFSTLHNVLKNFKVFCGYNWKSHKINKSNDLGLFLQREGYIVSDDGQQNGELQDANSMFGLHISKRLVGKIDRVYNSDKDFANPLEKLNEYLTYYYNACHIVYPSKKHPCSVYEMLVWLAGLRCNSVYTDFISDGLSDPFVDPNKKPAEGDELTVVTPEELYLDAYPKRITYNDTVGAIEHVCSASYDVLCTIAGTGDAHTIYAVDYCSNYLGLKYPTSGDECLQMFIDVFRRLLPPLRFLSSRCQLGAKHYGWRDCKYGKDIDTTKSLCRKQANDNAEIQAECQPRCQAKCEPNCQPTSPLMSYLNDCLPGHQPHQVSGIGCKPRCSTCPAGMPGMPCLTPLGFRSFRSSTKMGGDISEILDKFFTDSYLSSIFCLLPTPPSTLPEHFDFVLSLMTALQSFQHPKGNDVMTLQNALAASITDSSIKLYDQPTDLTNVLRDAYRSGQTKHPNDHPGADVADLSTLLMESSCVYPNRNVHCGPYLQSLCNDTYYYLASRHSNMYLSWVIYLPWTLYRYLKSLLEAFQNISCQDWGCNTCMQNNPCKPGKHGDDYNCQCSALVRCRGVLGAFYGYGFTFGDSVKLLDQNQRRYCHNFKKQLHNVLTSKRFGTLFTECDKFLWIIRQPFIWLNVALWLLSLFYLLHIMVIRLDLLHIKSHLHSPSYHRIAAQSLLAAGRVNKLNRVFYLQP